MQGTLSNPLVTIGVFIFTAIWWIVALGGISDAQSGANSASGALGYSGNAQLRFQWWQLWFEFFLLCGAFSDFTLRATLVVLSLRNTPGQRLNACCLGALQPRLAVTAPIACT